MNKDNLKIRLIHYFLKSMCPFKNNQPATTPKIAGEFWNIGQIIYQCCQVRGFPAELGYLM